MLEAIPTDGTHSQRRLVYQSLLDTRLAASPFLSDEERQALERVALSAKAMAAGSDLLRETEVAGHVQILIEGWAYRYKTTRDGHRQIVALLMPGDAANIDSSLFTQLDYGLRTVTAVNIVPIPGDAMLALAEQHAGIGKTLAWLAMIENAILSQLAVCLGRLSASQRLAHFLCEVNVRLGEAEDKEKDCFELPLTQEQIADVLGLTAVHVNRMIRQLRTKGLIDWKGRIVTIIDKDALRQLGEFDPAYLHDGRARLEPRAKRGCDSRQPGELSG